MPAWYAATTAKLTVIVGITVDFIPTATPVMISVKDVFECVFRSTQCLLLVYEVYVVYVVYVV